MGILLLNYVRNICSFSTRL